MQGDDCQLVFLLTHIHYLALIMRHSPPSQGCISVNLVDLFHIGNKVLVGLSLGGSRELIAMGTGPVIELGGSLDGSLLQEEWSEGKRESI